MKAMSINFRLFTIVVWLGVLANWAFAVWAIFFDTGKLLDLFGLGGVVSTIWVYNYSVLLIILSCFYIPAAHDPLRYEANAWLLVVGRWCRPARSSSASGWATCRRASSGWASAMQRSASSSSSC